MKTFSTCMTQLSASTVRLLALLIFLACLSLGTIGRADIVATPTFDPVPGTYDTSVDVTLSCTTPEAIIHYTLDGSTPTVESTEYEGAIRLNITTTVKAIAVKSGMDNSEVASGTYTINHAPVAIDQTVTTPEDTAKPITLSATDIDGNTLTYTVTGNPSHGQLTGTAPNLTYTPDENWHGIDRFTFKANDTRLDSNTGTVTIEVTAVNDPPVAQDKSVVVIKDRARPISLSATDIDSGSLTYAASATSAQGGTLTLINTAHPRYTPPAGYTGPDSFTYTASDGQATSNTATVTISVIEPIGPDPEVAPTAVFTAPTAGSTVTTGIPVQLSVVAVDYDGTIDSVEFRAGGQTIGSVDTPVDGVYSLVWTPEYESVPIEAVAIDNDGLEGVASCPTQAYNTPPYVNILEPAENLSVNPQTQFVFAAEAFDFNGSIDNLEFFLDEIRIESPNNPATEIPYAVVVPPLTWLGPHTLKVVATDNLGKTSEDQVQITASSMMSVRITEPGSYYPGPGRVANLYAPCTFTARAEAYWPGMVITGVRFVLKDSTQQALFDITDEDFPYSAEITDLPAGMYTLSAQALDENGQPLLPTDDLPIYVTDPMGPTVRITQPGAIDPYFYTKRVEMNGPATFMAAAEAYWPNHPIYGVRFTLRDNQQTIITQETVTTVPYQYEFTDLPNGAYTLTAELMQDETTPAYGSDQLDVTVTDPSPWPQLTITEPTPPTGYYMAPLTDGMAFTARASVYWPGHTMTGVRFTIYDYWNNVVTTTDATTAPYKADFNTGLTMGQYRLEAQVLDANGDPIGWAPSVTLDVQWPNFGFWVKISEPAEGASFAKPATLTVTAEPHIEAPATISHVEFYLDNATTPFADIDAPGPYRAEILPAQLTAIGQHTVHVIAYDDQTPQNSVTQWVTFTITNPPPTVRLFSPGEGANFTTPATVYLEAESSDTNGTVTGVTFYLDGLELEDLGGDQSNPAKTAPYRYRLSPEQATKGSHYAYVVATDEEPAPHTGSTTSALVNFTVTNPTPIVQIIEPGENTTFNTPATVNFELYALDYNGSVSHIDQLKLDNEPLADNPDDPEQRNPLQPDPDPTRPYRYRLDPEQLNEGWHTLTATVTDNEGDSTPVVVQFKVENPEPVVQMIGPADGAVISTPATVYLCAEAYDINGTIDEVHFFLNDEELLTADPPDPEKIGPDTTSPYSYRLDTADLPPGRYTVYAVADDNEGKSHASQTIWFVVANPAPQIAIDTNGTNIMAPGPFTIRANATDLNNQIDHVEFYLDGELLDDYSIQPYNEPDSANPREAAPYIYILRALKPGTYTLTAKAYDDDGQDWKSTLSAPVTLTVQPPHAPWEGADPTAGALNVATGTIALGGADLSVYNPNGLGVSFGREYHSDRAMYGEHSPGLPAGWFHNYDYTLAGGYLHYPNGAVELITGALGRPYVATGNVLTFDGNVKWEFTGGRLTRITNTVGRSVNLIWDSYGHLLRIEDPTTNPPTVLMRCNYDATPPQENSLLTSVVEVNGGQRSAGYSQGNGTLNSVTLQGGASIDYGYTTFREMTLLNEVSAPTGGGTATSTFTFNYGRPEVFADNKGSLICTNYGAGLAQTANLGGNTLLANDVYTYNTEWRSTGSFDAMGNNWTLSYGDVYNPARPTSVSSPDFTHTYYSYDQFGHVTSVVFETGISTTYSYAYDQNNYPTGRLVQTQESVPGKQKQPIVYGYDNGLLASITSAKPGATQLGDTVTTSWAHDAMGNVTSVTTPGPIGNITTTYDYGTTPRFGQPASVTVTGGGDSLSTSYTYDTHDRVETVTTAAGGTFTYTYNNADQLTCAQQGANGPRVEYSYAFTGGPSTETRAYDENNTLVRKVGVTLGSMNETTEVKVDNQTIASQDVDSLLRTTHLRDGNNNQTAITRNLRGFETKMQYPGTDAVEYGNYDPTGRVGTKIDTINGQPRIASYLYYGPGRSLSNVTYDGYPELNVGITRDTEGWVTDYSDGSGQVHINPTYGYDLSGNVLNGYASRTNGPAYLPIGYTYNPDGSPATQTTAMGNASFSYDGLGRPDGFTDASNGETNWEYDTQGQNPTGRLTKQTLYNGAYTTYGYNNRGQVTSMAHYKADDTLLAAYTDITYDGVGNVTGFTVNLPTMPQYSGTKTFHYDGKGRLDEETFTPDGQYTTDYDNTYGYDAAGNCTNFRGTERHYNSNNQWTEELVNGNWETMATYDGAGNPTSYKGHTLEFDAENRLTDFDNGDLLAGYDGDGLRAWKEVNGTRTHFVLDGTNVVGEMNNNGTARFTNNFGPSGLISRYNNINQTTVYYLFDPLGNVQHRLDGNGAILSSDIYDAWGNLIDGGDQDDPFGYKGEYGYYTDQETGFIICGHRYYDTTIGRWINRDPIEFRGGINQYRYCMDNPVNGIDPLGQKMYLCMRPVQAKKLVTGYAGTDSEIWGAHWYLWETDWDYVRGEIMSDPKARKDANWILHNYSGIKSIEELSCIGYGPEGDGIIFGKQEIKGSNAGNDGIFSPSTMYKFQLNLSHDQQVNIIKNAIHTAANGNRLNGTLWNPGIFGKGSYNFYSHNCQNFVLELLHSVGYTGADSIPTLPVGSRKLILKVIKDKNPFN